MPPVATNGFNKVNRPTFKASEGDGSRRRECILHTLLALPLAPLALGVTTVNLIRKAIFPP